MASYIFQGDFCAIRLSSIFLRLLQGHDEDQRQCPCCTKVHSRYLSQTFQASIRRGLFYDRVAASINTNSNMKVSDEQIFMSSEETNLDRKDFGRRLVFIDSADSTRIQRELEIKKKKSAENLAGFERIACLSIPFFLFLISQPCEIWFLIC